LDTPASAAAYYAAIDPRQERTSLGDWLRVNGFITDASSFTWEQLAASSSANAVYLNNYDLGFGRDMYARIVRCSDGAPPALGQPLPKSRRGNCDIAAVVINYASLEAATKRINPVLAVAMEYSTPVEGTRRIVQFYTFAPDAQTGRFARVRSANLDGRGEKYMPQVCTVCHGGTPGGLTSGGAYANGGDVNATFLPWDLDAFLFADSEGANSDRSYSDQSLRARYTRSAQAEALRRLNQIAYLTYEDATRPGRFALPRQLVEGWYGVDAGNAFTRTSFTSDYAPAGWTPEGVDGVANTADDNPSDATRIYQDVFARNCRACHIAHAPDPGAGGSHLETLVGASQTFNTCDRDLVTDAGGQNLEPASIGLQRQAPMGCYAHFFNAPRLPERLSAGVMPFARLTMDRLWVPAPGAASAGVSLFDHLDARYRATSNDARLAALSKPGTPAARVQVSTTPAGQADIGSTLRLDGARSTFASSFGWSLERCQSAAPAEPACRGGAAAEPDPAQLVCAPAAEPIVNPAGPSASFKAQGTGVYRATLRLNGNANSASGAVNVPDWRPCALSANVLDLGGVTLGTPVSIGIPALFTTGNAPLTEHRLFVTAPNALTLSRPECASAQGCAVGSGFSVTPTAVADNEVVVTLRDADGESANAKLRLRGTSTLSAANITDRFIRSNESLTVDLLAANGNPANVEVELLEQDCPDGREALACLRNPLAAVAGRDASVTPTASGFEYRPPANFSTHDVDGAPQFAPLERFLERVRYRLRRIDNPADFSPPAAVDVPVRARTRFTVAQGVFVAAPCSTCHAGAAATGPTYGTIPYTATPPDPMWREGDLIYLVRARVDLADAAESGFVCYPRNTCTTLHNIDATEEEVQTILDWISSGANNY
jgi:mono/diheme cytochrome c family protein